MLYFERERKRKIHTDKKNIKVIISSVPAGSTAYIRNSVELNSYSVCRVTVQLLLMSRAANVPSRGPGRIPDITIKGDAAINYLRAGKATRRSNHM